MSVSLEASIEKQLPTPTPKARPITKAAKYTQFPHNAKAHQIDCIKCHKFPSDNWKTVRPATEAFPDVAEYPKHDSCLNCHRQQFFKGAKPNICSICHTNPSPRDSRRHAFPNPREIFDQTTKGKNATSDFTIRFPHDKHIEIVSRNQMRSVRFANASWSRQTSSAAGDESCSVCHKTMMPQGDGDDEYVTKPPPKHGDAYWLKKGTFKSSPIGHANCFTCHSADTGIKPEPQNCAACHKLRTPEPPVDFDADLVAKMGVNDKVTIDSWKRRTSAGTFRHEWASHSELNCTACHTVAKLDTSDPKTTKVEIAKCATCHATATSDDGGAINYEVDSRKKNSKFECVKCHLAFGKLPIPESHLQAIAAAK